MTDLTPIDRAKHAATLMNLALECYDRAVMARNWSGHDAERNAGALLDRMHACDSACRDLHPEFRALLPAVHDIENDRAIDRAAQRYVAMLSRAERETEHVIEEPDHAA